MMEHYIEVGTDDSIAAFAQILYRMPPPGSGDLPCQLVVG